MIKIWGSIPCLYLLTGSKPVKKVFKKVYPCLIYSWMLHQWAVGLGQCVKSRWSGWFHCSKTNSKRAHIFYIKETRACCQWMVCCLGCWSLQLKSQYWSYPSFLWTFKSWLLFLIMPMCLCVGVGTHAGLYVRWGASDAWELGSYGTIRLSV